MTSKEFLHKATRRSTKKEQKQPGSGHSTPSRFFVWLCGEILFLEFYIALPASPASRGYGVEGERVKRRFQGAEAEQAQEVFAPPGCAKSKTSWTLMSTFLEETPSL
jgi:hypothetical protein